MRCVGWSVDAIVLVAARARKTWARGIFYLHPTCFQAGKHRADQRLAGRGGISTATTTKIRIRPHDALALIARMSIGAIFFLSGHTRVEGWLTVTDGTYSLFRDEYKLPLIPVEIAAHAAAWAEHLFPLLPVLGLCPRLSALALLGRRGFIRVDARRLEIGRGCQGNFGNKCRDVCKKNQGRTPFRPSAHEQH